MLLISIFSICFSLFSTAPAVFLNTYSLSPESTISVSGTSTLHDWTMTMEKVAGDATFGQSEDGLLAPANISIRLKAEDLKSEHKSYG